MAARTKEWRGQLRECVLANNSSFGVATLMCWGPPASKLAEWQQVVASFVEWSIANRKECLFGGCIVIATERGVFRSGAWVVAVALTGSSL